MAKGKGWQEGFARFFENPSREGLRELLQSHLGETNDFDFKRVWPALSKVARHILGLANYGGGCLFAGIEEKDDKTFDPMGIDELLDKADIHGGIEKFIPAQLKYEVLDFSYEDSEYPKIIGKKFQVIFVEDTPQYIPFVARDNGDGIRKNAIYTRRGTSTEPVNYEELQEILNRRIETQYSSQGELELAKHFAELRVLYDQIPRHIALGERLAVAFLDTNPRYPEEDLETFVRRLIPEKKSIIRQILRQS